MTTVDVFWSIWEWAWNQSPRLWPRHLATMRPNNNIYIVITIVMIISYSLVIYKVVIKRNIVVYKIIKSCGNVDKVGK